MHLLEIFCINVTKIYTNKFCTYVLVDLALLLVHCLVTLARQHVNNLFGLVSYYDQFSNTGLFYIYFSFLALPVKSSSFFLRVFSRTRNLDHLPVSAIFKYFCAGLLSQYKSTPQRKYFYPSKQIFQGLIIFKSLLIPSRI